LFDTHAHAETAAHDLERAGISHEDISFIANNANGQFGPADSTAPSNQAVGSETAKGAVAGGVTGLVLGLVAFAIPGLGTIAAAGWLTTALTGVVVGAGVGLVGALSGVGVPHEEAHYYAEGVRRGGTLLAIRAQDADADRIARILGADGAVNIDERAEQYRREGFVPGGPVVNGNVPVNVPVPASPVVGNEATRDTVLRTDANAQPLAGRHVGRGTEYEVYEERVEIQTDDRIDDKTGKPVA
jgi:uncharacterized membrane protein